MSTQDKKAFFAQTAENCRAAMYRVALGMLRSEADAEDAVSEAVIAAFSHLSRIHNMQALPGYLMKCTVNACHATLRRRKKEISADTMEAYGEANENAGNIWQYVHHLPEKYRLPLLLRYGEEWPLKEIARFLHVPKGTASARISRGLDMLKQELEKED